MIETSQTEIYLQPRELLEVTIQDGVGRRREVVVSLCRYVVVEDVDGRRVTALEIVYDPERPAPRKAYFCSAEDLVREVLDPRRVLSVKPYTW